MGLGGQEKREEDEGGRLGIGTSGRGPRGTRFHQDIASRGKSCGKAPDVKYAHLPNVAVKPRCAPRGTEETGCRSPAQLKFAEVAGKERDAAPKGPEIVHQSETSERIAVSRYEYEGYKRYICAQPPKADHADKPKPVAYMDLLFSAGNEIIIVTLGTENKIEPMRGASAKSPSSAGGVCPLTKQRLAGIYYAFQRG
jgi:hypothetical protein